MKYTLIQFDKIPDCCGSCISIRYTIKQWINLPVCQKTKRKRINIFGICDKFERDKTI